MDTFGPPAADRIARSSCGVFDHLGVAGVAASTLLAAAHAQDATSLAKAAQNPIANMVSLPFQYNANLDFGPNRQTQHVLNIQPVYPISFNPDWNLITRTIVPLISQPAMFPGDSRQNGLGDIQLQLFFSPKQPGAGGWTWGVGPIFLAPTASDDALGQGKWGAGPTAIALRSEGHWLYGALINNIWSFGGDSGRPDVNQMVLQPFVNYNVPGHPGLYFNSSPIITANWKADSGQRWTVPLGMGVGKITKWSNQPVNLQFGAYYNVERPDFGARWDIRAQVQFLFPR